MVRAILDGRKTQTRRVVKPDLQRADDIEPHASYAGEWTPWIDGERRSTIECPYGVPGDRLYVKEAWRTCAAYDSFAPSQIDSGAAVKWLSDDDKRLNGPEEWGRYRHARFMPRWASRITLEITDVRVERLQEIGEEDAIAEGVAFTPWAEFPPIEAFKMLWNAITHHPWNANPWVWAISFRRLP